MDPGNVCPGLNENITEYQINIQTGSFVISEGVDAAMCAAGRCSHTFEPASHLVNGRLPSSYDSVSVVAENVVGVGVARTCVAQPISELSVAVPHELKLLSMYLPCS